MTSISAQAVIGEFFESALTALSQGTVVTFPHGMNAAPHMVQVILECTTADLGHAVGDQLVMNPSANDFDESTVTPQRSNMISFDATNIFVAFPTAQAGQQPLIPSRTAPGTGAAGTLASWSYRVRAIRFAF